MICALERAPVCAVSPALVVSLFSSLSAYGIEPLSCLDLSGFTGLDVVSSTALVCLGSALKPVLHALPVLLYCMQSLLFAFLAASCVIEARRLVCSPFSSGFAILACWCHRPFLFLSCVSTEKCLLGFVPLPPLLSFSYYCFPPSCCANSSFGVLTCNFFRPRVHWGSLHSQITLLYFEQRVNLFCCL